MDRLACLETFVRVADAGSFAKAAEPLSLSPAMVGRQVAWLEDRLGVRLLARTTRRQSLTEAGRLYLAHARTVLAEIEAGERSVTRMRTTPTGLLRIDAPQSFGASSLAPALADFRERYPDIRIELTLNNRVVDLIEEGYDAVIRTGELPDSGLMVRTLAPYHLIACASPAYLARHGMPASPPDLRDHSCLRFRPRADHETWRFVDRAGDAGDVVVDGALTSNSGQALRAAALAGMGVIVQPEALVAGDLRAGRLVRIMPGWDARSLPLHLLHAATRNPPPKLRAFIDFVAEHFGRGA